MKLSRRTFLGGLAVSTVTALGAYMVLSEEASNAGVSQMSPPELLDAVRANQVLLVDVRRPDEWERTGLAEGAVPIDLRRPDFVEAVKSALGTQTKPVAVICARGVRSKRMTKLLIKAGVTPIIDVPEGMLGSFSGPGWLKRNLPVVTWSG